MKKIATLVVAGMIVLAPAATATAAAHSPANSSSVASQAVPSGPQAQAIRMAKSYLDYTAFSRSGLIGQLKYEGFSTRHATRAVDSIRVSWKKQAAEMAQDYLDYTAFSRAGLIGQLKHEGFTSSQARYGVRSVGL